MLVSSDFPLKSPFVFPGDQEVVSRKDLVRELKEDIQTYVIKRSSSRLRLWTTESVATYISRSYVSSALTKDTLKLR